MAAYQDFLRQVKNGNDPINVIHREEFIDMLSKLQKGRNGEKYIMAVPVSTRFGKN